MLTLDNVPTPCVLIDEKRMESNLAHMAAKLQAERLRPHTKTHKSVALAKRQIAHGAQGITVAKISEAEKFIQHGLDDVRIAYTLVGKAQLDRVIQLSQKAHISFCIDTVEGARRASNAFCAAGIAVDVLLEIDTGHGRCGVPHDSEDLITIAQEIQKLQGLRLCGILTHEGDAYKNNVMAQSRDRMLDATLRLAEVCPIEPGLFEISMGSTSSVHIFENKCKGPFQVTELRPGNYIFNDLTQVSLGVCSLDACAMTVLSTVVSRRRTYGGTERFMLDAGRKILTSDSIKKRPGYGCILYNPRVRVAHPHARITGLSEEHGWGVVQGGSTLNIGDRIQIIPNHACVVANMVDRMFLVQEGSTLSEIVVDARGCVV